VHRSWTPRLVRQLLCAGGRLLAQTLERRSVRRLQLRDLAGQRVCRVLQCSTPCALGSRPDKRIAGAGEALAEEAY